MEDQNDTSKGDDKPKSLQERIEAAVQKDPVVIAITVAFGATVGAYCGVKVGKAAERVEWHKLMTHLTERPIPSLNLSEEEIKRRLAAGILFDMYIRKQGLREGFDEYADMVTDELVGTRG